MAGPRPIITHLYYGCEELTAVDNAEQPHSWDGHPNAAGQPTIFADLLAAQNKIIVNRGGERLTVPLIDADRIDVYVSPAGESLHTEVAATGTRVAEIIAQRCHVPEKMADSSQLAALLRPLRAALQQQLAEKLPGTASAIVHDGRTTMLGVVAAQIVARDMPFLLAELKKIRTGVLADARLIIVAPSRADCAGYRSVLSAAPFAICVANPTLPRQSAMVLLVPPTAAVIASLEEYAHSVARNAPVLQDAIGLTENAAMLHGARQPKAQIQRIIYGECDEMFFQNGAETASWALPSHELTVWTSQRSDMLIAQRFDEVALLPLPYALKVDVYLPKDLRFVASEHIFYHQSTTTQSRFSDWVQATQHCSVPITALEKEQSWRARYYPHYSLGVLYRFGAGGAHVTQIIPPPPPTFGHIFAALDCNPSKLHLDCPGLDDAKHLVPDYFNNHTLDLNVQGGAITFEADVWQNHWLQFYAGAEIDLTHLTDMPRAVPIHNFLDANVRLGVRSAWLAFGAHMLVPGVAVGGGVGVGMPDYQGVSTYGLWGGDWFVEAPLWRLAGSIGFLEIALRFEGRYYRGSSGGLPTTVTIQNFNMQQMVAPNETMLLTFAGGLFFGAPTPIEDVTPQYAVLLTSQFLPTPPIALTILPDDATLAALLALSDRTELLSRVNFRTPLHDNVEIVADAFAQMAAQIMAQDSDAHIEVGCAVDTEHDGDIVAKMHLADNGARLAKHILIQLGVPAQRLIAKAWNSTEVQRIFAKSDGEGFAHYAASDGMLFIAVLKPREE